MKNTSLIIKKPPIIASRFLSWALPEDLIEPILGDLSEEYQQRISTYNLFNANYWYYRQSIKSGTQFMLKTQRGFIMFILSVLLFLGLTFFAMDLAADISVYMDISSILMIFPPAIIFTYAATSNKDVKQAIAILLGNNVNVDKQAYKASKRVFTVLGNSGMLLGIFMTLIGWIAIAELLDDISHFGVAFSVSLLTLLYGIGLKVLSYVAEQKIQTLSER